MQTKIHIIPSFHYDVAYQKTYKEYLVPSLENIHEALKLLQKYPDYTYSIEQVILVQEFWDRNPGKRSLMKKFVKEGRLFFAPGMYTMPDSNMPSGENFIRNALLGRDWLQQNLNTTPRCCWMADIFGHNPQSPQLAKICGYDSYMFERGKAGGWETPFSWRGIDGTEINAQWEVDTYYGINLALAWQNSRPDEWLEKRIYDEIITPLQNDSPCKSILMSPLGGDFLKPLKEQIEFVHKWNRKNKNVKMLFSTPEAYFDELKKKRAKLKVADDDLNPLMEGCCSSRIRIKQYNRSLEETAATLEMLESICQSKEPYSETDILWKIVTKNAFHDIIAGTLRKDAVKEAYNEYKIASSRSNRIINSKIDKIAKQIVSPGKERGVLVFNSLPYQRREIVEVNDKFFEATIPPASFSLVQSDNKKKQAIKRKEAVRTDGRILENEFIKVKFGDNGTIVSLYDKQNKCELAVKNKGMNNPLHQADYGDLWTIETGPVNGSLLRTAPYHNPHPPSGSMIVREGRLGDKAADADCFDWPEPKIIHADPLQATIEFNYKQMNIRTRVSLRKGEKLVRFKTWFMPTGKKYRLRVAFPVNVKNGKIRHSVPCGHIDRPEGEYATQGWIDYADKTKGLLLLNKGLPGNNVTGGSMLLSLFRGVSMEKTEKNSWYEEGVEHELEYAIMPFNPKDKTYNPARCAALFNRELYIKPVKKVDAKVGLLARKPLIELTSDNVELTCIRKVENTLIVRLWETCGKSGKTDCVLSEKISSCLRSDATGENERTLKFNGNKIPIQLRPFEIITLKINMNCD